MKKKSKDAFEIIRQEIQPPKDFSALLGEARINVRIAQMIYDARVQAGFSQKELAVLIGTQQSAISRLEDADYDGHSLSMLQKIAAALGSRIEIKFVPSKEKEAA